MLPIIIILAVGAIPSVYLELGNSLELGHSVVMPLIDPQQVYTYSRYFELRIDPIDLCEYFGYALTLAELLPRQADWSPIDVTALQQRLSNMATRLMSRNEQAKQEMFVAPVIEFVVEVADALIRIEYPINVSAQLQGNVDYLVSVDHLAQLLVIAAKRDDIDYGFTQLMAELIALDQWERSPSSQQQPVLIGAVTTGTLWQFARLDRTSKQMIQGINGWRSPEDLATVVQILIGALRAAAPPL